MLQSQWEMKLWIVLKIETGRMVCADEGHVGDFRHMANIYVLGTGQRCASSPHKKLQGCQSSSVMWEMKKNEKEG